VLYISNRVGSETASKPSIRRTDGERQTQHRSSRRSIESTVFSKDPTDAFALLPSDAGQRLSLAVNSASTVDRRNDAFATDASDDTVAASVDRSRQIPPIACDRRV
jgi:hypothetical protein